MVRLITVSVVIFYCFHLHFIFYMLTEMYIFMLPDEFMKTLKKRLHSLLTAHDDNTILPRSWVIKEALNIDALQEAGTFR